MALFAVKRQGGHDTMLVVEAATAEAADGWLVFRSADGQPLASLRVEHRQPKTTTVAAAYAS